MTINIVNISGGVDSTACYLMALERGEPFRAVFADTGKWCYAEPYRCSSRLGEYGQGRAAVHDGRAPGAAELQQPLWAVRVRGITMQTPKE